MEKSILKIFFSKSKELAWLNSLGKQGYLLNNISDSRYYFQVSENAVYTYSIEYLDAHYQSESSQSYIENRKAVNVYPVVAGKNWIYFVTEAESIDINSSVYTNNAKPYFWRCMYLLLMSVMGSILCGYQAFASSFILNSGHTGTGNIPYSEIDGNSFGDVFAKIWNAILKFIDNTYMQLLRNIFGESDAVFVLAIAIPITIISTVFLALNLNEYINYKLLAKQDNNRRTGR